MRLKKPYISILCALFCVLSFSLSPMSEDFGIFLAIFFLVHGLNQGFFGSIADFNSANGRLNHDLRKYTRRMSRFIAIMECLALLIAGLFLHLRQLCWAVMIPLMDSFFCEVLWQKNSENTTMMLCFLALQVILNFFFRNFPVSAVFISISVNLFLCSYLFFKPVQEKYDQREAVPTAHELIAVILGNGFRGLALPLFLILPFLIFMVKDSSDLAQITLECSICTMFLIYPPGIVANHREFPLSLINVCYSCLPVQLVLLSSGEQWFQLLFQVNIPILDVMLVQVCCLFIVLCMQASSCLFEVRKEEVWFYGIIAFLFQMLGMYFLSVDPALSICIYNLVYLFLCMVKMQNLYACSYRRFGVCLVEFVLIGMSMHGVYAVSRLINHPQTILFLLIENCLELVVYYYLTHIFRIWEDAHAFRSFSGK